MSNSLRPVPRSEVFLRADLTAILRGIVSASRGVAPSDFAKGFAQAINAVALAIHIDPDDLGLQEVLHD